MKQWRYIISALRTTFLAFARLYNLEIHRSLHVIKMMHSYNFILIISLFNTFLWPMELMGLLKCVLEWDAKFLYCPLTRVERHCLVGSYIYCFSVACGVDEPMKTCLEWDMPNSYIVPWQVLSIIAWLVATYIATVEYF